MNIEEYFNGLIIPTGIKFTDLESIQRRLYKCRDGSKTGMSENKIRKRRRRKKLAKKARRR